MKGGRRAAKMKRFIEETFPVKDVSLESAREKNIRHGHISTLHIWWARRPLASSRATAYAALTPPPENIDEWSRKRDFIINLSTWENSLNPHLIERAKQDILDANGGVPPKVLEPFGGGGTIPLEALRLGCETYSNDLNPVAVLIQKCTLEYPQKYGRPKEVEAADMLSGVAIRNPLLEDVKKWAAWVLAEAKKELGHFYRQERDGSIPVGYIWARTIPCQNPSCRAEIPLMRQFWLAKKANKKVALYPSYIENGCVKFKIVGDSYEPMPDGFDPTNGTISQAIAVCEVCGSTVEAKMTRKLFQDKKAGERLVAVVTHIPGVKGKRYRVATADDLIVFRETEVYLAEKREKLTLEWGMDAVPDEIIHTPDGKEYKPGNPLYRSMPIALYGLTKWRDLFNTRQKLALITFVEKVKMAYQKMVAEGVDEEYVKAVVSYLALGVDMTIAFSNTLARWENSSEAIKQLYSRQALSMLWDYAEVNPFSGSSGSFEIGWKYYLKVIAYCSHSSSTPANVTQFSATNLPHHANFFDAVFTDPPYYDNVPYANLSDFFYVWLKRTIGDLYPELFSTPMSPKSNEVIAELPLLRGMDKEKAAQIFKNIKTKERFEIMLKQSFQEIYRVLKPNGIAVIVYAHKSTEGWETLINSLLDSGLIMTGAWPLDTEMKGRLNALETAALTSSIYIIARKIEREPTGFYNEVKAEMRTYLNAKLHRLWEEGLGGADFFIAAIGSAIEVFGKYEKVMDFEGEIIRADRLLDDVREIATDYAVQQILQNGFAGEISDLTRFYVLWRWEYGEARVLFDEARKLAQSCGVDLSQEWEGKGFIVKEKAFIRVLGPQARKMDDFEEAEELIDVLHHVLLFWEISQRAEMIRVLDKSSYGETEAFYRVAQAISETLPIESREKKLLDGFLAGRERIKEEIRQGRLF